MTVGSVGSEQQQPQLILICDIAHPEGSYVKQRVITMRHNDLLKKGPVALPVNPSDQNCLWRAGQHALAFNKCVMSVVDTFISNNFHKNVIKPENI